MLELYAPTIDLGRQSFAFFARVLLARVGAVSGAKLACVAMVQNVG